MATFTNFACRNGGSNLNAGSRTGDTTVPGTAASFTYASGTWVNATGVFTVASGNPLTDGVAVGDFASVYPDAATVTPFVGRVTARDATTITVSLTAKAGTAPADGTTNTTLKIGGAWKGPNAAENFPFGFVQATLTNVAGNWPRVNFMNDATYSVTAAVAHGNNGLTYFQGFTSAYGDLGKATLDGGTSGASYVLLTTSGTQIFVEDMIIQNNGASGLQDGYVISGADSGFSRVVVNNVRGRGIFVNARLTGVEAEVYACCKNNTAEAAITVNNGAARLIRCIAHNNTGSHVDGFSTNQGGTLIECISDSNGQHGLSADTTNITFSVIGCEFYNNGADGANVSGTNTNKLSIYFENCNFIKNTGWGLNATAPSTGFIAGRITNCGFGSGTQANGSGNNNLPTSVDVVGSVTYTANLTPWVAPTTGNFSINLAAAENTGRGAFTETAASYTGTMGFPDIGAATHQASSGGGGGAGSGVIGLGL